MVVLLRDEFDPPTEGLLMQSPGTKLIVNDQELGTGTLYITENNVVWGGGQTVAGSPASTLTLLYPTISLHAIQREPSSALYLMLNYQLRMPEMQPESPEPEDEDDFDTDIEQSSQLRFVPQDESSLSAMYNALTTGQSLHPDQTDDMNPFEDDDYMDGEDQGDDDDFEDAEESGAGDAAARLQGLQLNQSTAHDNGDASGNGHQ